MAYDSLSVSEIIPARPERIYAAWLSSDEHTAFTGDKAVVEPFVGGKHSTFDGYANGHTVELQPGKRIVQTWRAEDFPLGSPDSRVEVTLEETVGGTMVTIFHSEIPSGQGSSCRDGWLKFYLEPLKSYFVAEAKPAARLPPKAARATAASAAKKRVAKPKPKARAKAKPPKPIKKRTKRTKTAKAARPKVTKPKRAGQSRGGAKRRARR
ncbi:MAG TPA: SRPBCC domain-containing protein [Polyangia bacterium]|nr:SRPBCC domain-containing protein [Polyangia bacterium]